MPSGTLALAFTTPAAAALTSFQPTPNGGAELGSGAAVRLPHAPPPPRRQPVAPTPTPNLTEQNRYQALGCTRQGTASTSTSTQHQQSPSRLCLHPPPTTSPRSPHAHSLLAFCARTSLPHLPSPPSAQRQTPSRRLRILRCQDALALLSAPRLLTLASLPFLSHSSLADRLEHSGHRLGPA
ncbi:hypothetical protein TPAR_00175 [Tolypocladium paradoxum]|uniref:Uncharacterized protein n=1 Tax=Tolypocladium paradoxum TaxID=94208 RepID=A0A2S4LB18_9HYPO|nr:hypothetical protein TPAR_00175 [Tolypocladium paradoxum]